MRNYTKIQKTLSFVLIFSILFSFSINITFFGFIGQLFAGDAQKFKIVSIFVQEEIYRQIEPKIKRYASDIQGVLPDTKTMIIPVSSQEHPYNIASLLEKLYFEGYNGIAGLGGESRLIGSVFVGNIPLPIVENQGNFEKTVFPYTDFENKLYVYNETAKRYQPNPDFIGEPKVEIWHGFISPNTGDAGADITQIRNFFDKNNDFYKGQGNYGQVNALNSAEKTDYEPYVLYYDQIREFQALNYVNYKAYEQYGEYKEDITYDRYSKELADALQSSYNQEQSALLSEASTIIDPSLLASIEPGADVSQVPDILTRHIIQKSIKKFPEIFNTDVLGQFRKDVHNAGRYNISGGGVNIDLIPHMIANMDVFSQSIIKNVNFDLEKEIDQKVKNGLARNVAVLTEYHTPYRRGVTTGPFEGSGVVYKNFFYGNLAESINNADQCSIYRGNNAHSGTLVESNRAYNMSLAQQDADLCRDKTKGFWGGNSPLNIDTQKLGSGYTLKENNPLQAIRPLFDVAGQKKSGDDTLLHSPLSCYQNSLLLYQNNSGERFPLSTENNDSRVCDMTHLSPEIGMIDERIFDEMYDGECSGKQILLDGEKICGSSGVSGFSTPAKYFFKQIPSWVEHKSPTQEELIAQVKSQTTPNLAIDKNRYIDFVTASGEYAKIEYPFLFRIGGQNNLELSFGTMQILLRQELRQKSEYINEIILENDPLLLSPEQQEIYDFLKNGEYPQADVDLLNVLHSKPSQEVEIFGETKNINYMDMVSLALYWNNLPSVSAKYKFIYEYQFGDQMLRDDLGFFLPKNKSLYDMSYMVVPGETKNMFVKMDGEDKGENPYSDILAQNIENQAYLQLSHRHTSQQEGEEVFRCSPPDGVPLQDWLPAINCWIEEMLPPKIEFKTGNCSVNNIFDFEDSSFFERYEGQGILEFLESEFAGGYIKIDTETESCGYNTTSNISFGAYNKDDELLEFDNYSQARFQIKKIEIPRDPLLLFNSTNTQTFFDRSTSTGGIYNNDSVREKISDYIVIPSTPVRLKNGKTSISYTTKNYDANIDIEVEFVLKDHTQKELLTKTETFSLQIRGDELDTNIYHLSDFGGEAVVNAGVSNVKASSADNIFVVGSREFLSLQNNSQNLQSLSSSEEKLFLTLSSRNNAGKDIPLEYPIEVEILYNDTVQDSFTLESPSLQPKSFGAFSQAGNYQIIFKDSMGRVNDREFFVSPGDVEKVDIQLGTNLKEKDSVVTHHMFVLYDQYGNIVTGKNETVEVFLEGNSVTFEDGTKSKVFQVFEGYRKFSLKSTAQTGNTKVSLSVKRNEKQNIILAENISVVDEIFFDINITDELKVGGEEYQYEIIARAPNELSSFQSRAYLVQDGIYTQGGQAYTEILNNTGTGTLKTKNKATENITLQWQIEGVKNPVFKQIKILPDIPIRLNLLLDKSHIEANALDFVQGKVQLQDRYGNVVFSDNTTKVSLEIDGKYSSILTTSADSLVVQKGEAHFLLRSTSVPGTAFFKVSADASLEDNTVSIIGQTPFSKEELSIPGFRDNEMILSRLGNTFFVEYDQNQYKSKFQTIEELQSSTDFQALSPIQQQSLGELFTSKNTINIGGISQNVGSVQSYYFWNKDKIKDTHHNSLYATLLGASYGDITQRDALGNALLFEPTSKTLAVTSLLSDLKKQNEVLKISPNGNINFDARSLDLSQDISQSVNINQQGNLYFNFFNNTFDSLVSQIFVNFAPEKTLATNCTTIALQNCFDSEKTTLALYTTSGEYIYSGDKNSDIRLNDVSGKEIISLSQDGKISMANYVQLSLNQNHTGYLALDVKINGKAIAMLAIHFPNGQVSLLRDISRLQTLRDIQAQGGMIVYLESVDYSAKTKFLGESTQEKSGLSIVYNDPFASNSNQYSHFLNHFDFGYEFALKNKGLGWEGNNKTLLSFAAGKNVGEATKDYASFSLINLGDPVVSLTPLKKELPSVGIDRKFDSTIGNILSLDKNNLTFTPFDYNGDGKQDIALLKRNGFIELLEGGNTPGDFESKGHLVYMSDFSSQAVLEAGDFNGDGYYDLVLLDKDAQLVLFHNQSKDFQRVDIHATLGIEGKIMQVIVFDMDDDGKDDLVVYDDSGTIHIFYGGGSAGNLQFTQKIVTSDLGALLSSEPRTDGGLVFFEGMYQLSQAPQATVPTNSEALFEEIQNNINTLTSQPQALTQPSDMNEELFDNLLFVNIPYRHPFLDTLPGIDNNEQTNSIQKTFLYSQYGETQGLEITKTFVDINGGNLQSGDQVMLEIEIQNTSLTRKNNIAYLEKLPEILEIDTQRELFMNIGGRDIDPKNITLKNSPFPGYAFLIDEYNDSQGELGAFDLHPGQRLSFKIPLLTRNFQGGSIEVGLFEEGEPGDDEYGDIVFKTQKQSCAEPQRIYRSIQAREYQEGTKEMSCEQGLPDDLAKNQIDLDGNGIPDYIDELLEGGDALQQYAQETLSTLLQDSDGDGIPDDEDWNPYFNDNEDFLSSLDRINETVDDVVGGMDNLMDGFSCGFGGGSCLSLPMNWAPLAPGNDPTLFGTPIGDGLKIEEGMPIFSMLTWMYYGPVCGPSVWPISPLGTGCGESGAGGYLGTDSPTNFFRLFVTPTLTGAVGVAMCFGGPASVAGNAMMPGVSPLIPGGNCIVYAKPVVGCKNDGSDGEIYNVALPSASGNGFGVINGNCGTPETQPTQNITLPADLAQDYLYYKRTGVKGNDLEDKAQEFLGGAYTQVNQGIRSQAPLISVFEGSEGSEFSLSVDLSSRTDADFSDIVQIQMQRVAAFPDFLMEWVRRQIEEIVTKLTAFPTLFVVLPDFDGVFDGFGDFSSRYDDAFEQGAQKQAQKEDVLEQRIQNIQSQKQSLNCESEADKMKCLHYDIQLANLSREQTFGTNQTTSGIRGVYEFLGNLPMISIVPEQVNVNIPWIDESTLNKAILEWEITSQQWKEEWQRVKTSAGWNQYNCVGTPSTDECRIILNIENLITSLDKNIEILKSYKAFPQDLKKLFDIKELRLEQILCNVEIISEIVGGWIGENGKRFRAWVDLYILVKAILKSWQVFIDVFLDYEAECHQCKNERNDLQYFIWKLISAVIPSIPIVEFPKWPDIYMDLHNIRVGMQVAIPDFHFNLRPILIPTLPELTLPDAPYINIKIPELPILPQFEIPELPDLPTLPSVELPDLPPPPKLPKLFSSLEGVLKILKLVTKAMCILKFSPFVPEWKAGDQIAFMTERSGFLSADFLQLTLPQFSYASVDAIKISTYVNLEFETEFLTEAARQITLPLNSFTNNIVRLLDVRVDDFDLSLIPSEINIEIQEDGSIDNELGMTQNEEISLFDLGMLFAQGVPKIFQYLEKEGSQEISTEQFKQKIIQEISNSNLSKDIHGQKLAKIWADTLQYSFERENALIDDLQKTNTEKFQVLENVIQNEMSKNTKLQTEILDILHQQPQENVLISETSSKKDIQAYNDLFDGYNVKALQATLTMLKPDADVQEIQQEAQHIQSQVQAGIDGFEKEIIDTGKNIQSGLNNTKQSLLAMNEMNRPNTVVGPTNTNNASIPNIPSAQSCHTGDGASYTYKGIYIVEKFLGKNISYRLFDYLDELKGDEKVKEINDHLVYMVGNELFFKKNHLVSVDQNYLTTSPIVVSFKDTTYAKGKDFIPAVNNFAESIAESGYINLKFQAHTNPKINNYRITFYDIVDKFSDQMQGFLSGYLPKKVKKHVIEAFSNIDEITQNMERVSNAPYILRKNLATLEAISNFSGIEMYTRELKNLRTDINEQKQVIVNMSTPLYAGERDVNIVYYTYAERNNPEKYQSVLLRKHSNIQFNTDVILASVSSDAYIAAQNFTTLRGSEVLSYRNKPLFPGTKIEYKPNERTVGGVKRIQIGYYDGSQFEADFSDMTTYEIVSLGNVSKNYSVRTQIENDYYYAKIQAFSGNIYSTYSNQILLSPQIQADKFAPEILGLSALRVPVYQKQRKDITEFIYENSGVNNIMDIYIDLDSENDSSGNGILSDDKDVILGGSHPNITILKTSRSVFLDIGPYEEIFTKQMRLFLVDANNNIGYKDMQLEIYPPTPNISRVEGSLVVGNIDERLENEPISLYRMRGGNIHRLQTRQGNMTTPTQENGVFNFIAENNPTGLMIRDEERDVAKINEKTGHIEILSVGNYSLVVYSTGDRRNTSVFPQITVLKNGVAIYSQHIVIPDVGIVQTVNNFIEVIEGRFQAKPGVYVKKSSSDYELFTLPSGIAKNAGDMIVYKADDSLKQAITTIYKDGRIELANEGFFLEYSTFGEYVVLKILERGTSPKEIAQVLLIPEGNFVVE